MNSSIPKRFRETRFSQLDAKSKIANVARKWTTQYIDGTLPQGRGLALIGAPGRGKTAVACAVLNEIRVSEGDVTDHTIGYTTFEGYLKRERRMMTLNNRLARTEDADDLAALREIDDHHLAIRNDITVMVIDDVGKEHTTATAYAEDEFDFLLRHRFDLGLTTLLTSNIAIDQWGQRYSDAMESFIHEAFQIVKATGVDYRK